MHDSCICGDASVNKPTTLPIREKYRNTIMDDTYHWQMLMRLVCAFLIILEFALSTYKNTFFLVPRWLTPGILATQEAEIRSRGSQNLISKVPNS
jgi:hypothetical protein